MSKRRFKPIPTMSQGVNISDSILIVEGGLHNWRSFDAEQDRQQYDAEKAQFGAAAMASAMPCTPGSQEPMPLADAPLCDAFATPLTPPPAPRTVRRFTPRPRPGGGDAEGDFRITRVIGALPDWRHYEENRARARDEYVAQLEAAKNIAQPEVTPGAFNEYQQAKDGESLAETLTPAQTLTIQQLMDPGHEFTKAVASPKTEQDS